jgi:hypothetical protein
MKNATRIDQGKFTVILNEEEGGYSFQCVELPGAISQGKIETKHFKHKRSHSGLSGSFSRGSRQIMTKEGSCRGLTPAFHPYSGKIL